MQKVTIKVGSTFVHRFRCYCSSAPFTWMFSYSSFKLKNSEKNRINVKFKCQIWTPLQCYKHPPNHPISTLWVFLKGPGNKSTGSCCSVWSVWALGQKVWMSYIMSKLNCRAISMVSYQNLYIYLYSSFRHWGQGIMAWLLLNNMHFSEASLCPVWQKP